MKARPAALNQSNIDGGWRGAGMFPLNKIRILKKLQPAESTPPPCPPADITTPTTVSPLYLSSSPPDAITIHQKNTALLQIIEKSNLDSPIRDSLRRGLGFGERFLATISILKTDNRELREHISNKKERESGKRVILKGKFIVSTEEVYEKIAEAEAKTKAKQDKKKGKKDKIGEKASTEEEEGLPLVMQGVGSLGGLGDDVLV